MSVPTKSRRKRLSLVCSHCKAKKIKCDKGKPCSPCIKSKLSATCTYSTLDFARNEYEQFKIDKPYIQSSKTPIEIVVTKNKKALSKPSPNGTTDDNVVVAKSELQFLKDRLMHIEESLAKNKSSNSGDSSSSGTPVDLESVYSKQSEGQNQAFRYYESASSGGAATQPSAYYSRKPLTLDLSPPPPPIMLQGNGRRISVTGVAPTSAILSPREPTVVPFAQNIQLPPLRWSQQQQLQEQQRLNLFQQQRKPSTSSPPQQPPQQASYNVSIPTTESSLHLISSSSYPRYVGSLSTGLSVSSVASPINIKEPDSAQLQQKLDGLCMVTESSQLVGINPYYDEEERMNLFANYTSLHVKEPTRRINYGPFAWSSLMKRDTGLKMLWDYLIEQKANSKEKFNVNLIFAEQATTEITQENTDFFTSETKEQDQNGLEDTFKRRALEPDGFGDVIPYNSILKREKEKQKEEENSVKASKSRLIKEESAAAAARTSTLLQLGFNTKSAKLGRELAVIDKIQIILPKKKVIWMLVDRFFTWLYPFMPYLDYDCFIQEISSMIGPRSYEDVELPPLKVEKRLDLAILGILLLVLRLAYLSLFSNKMSINPEKIFSDDPSLKAADKRYLYSNPINIDFADVAQLCLDQFDIFRKTSLIILQLAIYLRIYHAFAPEDGDGADGGDSQVFGAMLVQMTYSLGLHRDPDNFPDICNNPKMNHLGRKIFHLVCVMDIHQCYTFGNPLSINPTYYDVKYPFFDENATNIPDVKLDRSVTEQSAKCFAIYSMVPLLQKLLNAREGFNVSEVCKELGKFEAEVMSTYGSANECFCLPLKCDTQSQLYLRNVLTKYFLSLNSFFISIYFHFYLYYEPKSEDLSFYYLKKLLLISTGEIMPYYFDILGNKEYICDMIINPIIQQFIHKANIVNLALLVRVNCILYHYVRPLDHKSKYYSDPEYQRSVDAVALVSRLLKRSVEISISAISKLSNRYYYSWRITKGHTYLLKIANDVKFYDNNYSKSGNMRAPIYTTEQVDLFIGIIKRTVDKFDYVEELVPDFCPCKEVPASLRDLKEAAAKKPTDYKEPDFDKDFVKDADIDLIWLQMISQKYDNKAMKDAYGPLQYQASSHFNIPNEQMGNLNNNMAGPNPGTTQDGTFANSSQENYTLNGNPNGNGQVNGNMGSPANHFDLRHGFDLEELARFDIFNDLPFDQVFGKN